MSARATFELGHVRVVTDTLAPRGIVLPPPPPPSPPPSPGGGKGQGNQGQGRGANPTPGTPRGPAPGKGQGGGAQAQSVAAAALQAIIIPALPFLSAPQPQPGPVSIGFNTLVVKAADTARASNAVLTADPDLTFAIGSSSTESWFFEVFVIQNGANTTMNSQYGISAPSGATGSWGVHDTTSNSFAGWNAVAPAGAPGAALTLSGVTALGTGANNNQLLYFAGWVFGGGTAGAVTLTWAQNTSNASNLTLKKGSMLRATKLST